MSKRSLIFLTALTVLLTALPYVYASQNGGGDFVFNGFLLNPLDGNSYLAKMREGWQGSWQFRMLYSSQPPEGSYLNLYYLFLGHVARWLGLPLILAFHFARIAGAIVLCLMLHRFIETYLSEQSARARTIAFVLLGFGSGLGWLAAFFGGFTADFWVAEAYPFLSMNTNPHFPLGMALMLDFLVLFRLPQKPGFNLWLIVKGILTAIIMPFGVFVAAVVAGGVQLWEYLKHEHSIRWWMLNFFVPAGLILIYQFAITRSDTILAAWNAQNQTTSPPLWDFVISFSPALLLSCAVIALLIKNKQLPEYKLLVVWLVGGLLLAYFPFQLQRRFLLGYFVPAACLAAIALDLALADPKKCLRIGSGMLIGFSLITNLLVILGGLLAASQRSPDLYYPKSFQGAFDWMLDNKKSCDVVLAAPDTGGIVPGATGWRVVYGHPFETPNAAKTEADVVRIFSGEMTQTEIASTLHAYNVDFVLIGPSEKQSASDLSWLDTYPMIYSEADVTLYQVGECQP